MIQERFGFHVPVFVISQERLGGILQKAPSWWGNGDKEIYDNLIFMIPPVTFEEMLAGMGGAEGGAGAGLALPGGGVLVLSPEGLPKDQLVV